MKIVFTVDAVLNEIRKNQKKIDFVKYKMRIHKYKIWIYSQRSFLI